MRLTPEQEAEYIARNSKGIWKIVNRFRIGALCSADPADLWQEGAIALLNYVRKVKSYDELRVFPVEDIRNAISTFLVGQQVVSYPKRTSDFNAVVKASKRVTLESIEECVGDTDNDWIRTIDFRDYLKKIPEETMDMIRARYSGESNNSIAKRHRLSPGAVTHRVQRAMKDYLNDIA